MNEGCDVVRDRLPEFTTGRLTDAEAVQLRSHLAGCDGCATELALVRAIHADRVTVPPGLEDQVRDALRSGDRRTVFTTGRVAIAASVVFALAAAGALELGGPQNQDVLAEALAPPPWPSADEPLMHGGPALNQLSVDELQSLLEEMES